MSTTGGRYDIAIVGAGTSGLTLARELSRAGARVICLEAGGRYTRQSYPRHELAASAQLYWSGGLELTKDASLALLRPRVVGGGSIVNQALMDRFDDLAWDDFRAVSGIPFFTSEAMAPYYQRAEAEIALQTVPEGRRNRNAEIFAEGFAANGYRYAPLRRGQRDCRFEDGNSCIECLGGCRIDSKQSMAITALPDALAHGLTLVPQVEIGQIVEHPDHLDLHGTDVHRAPRTWQAARVILAAGAIGNSRLLLRSGFGDRLPVGHGFYTHPQYMNFGRFKDPVDAFRGPLQNYKSDDPGFRRQGFKLENVFAGPASIAMLLPGHGSSHLRLMRDFRHYACIEVCVRDQHPGRVTVDSRGQAVIDKSLDAQDQRRKQAGMEAIRNIFTAMGAESIIPGRSGFGLHLMGGCAIGTDPATSVVGPDFTLHGSTRVHAADSSIFPNAPGINPALSIMALSIRAADTILQVAR